MDAIVIKKDELIELIKEIGAHVEDYGNHLEVSGYSSDMSNVFLVDYRNIKVPPGTFS